MYISKVDGTRRHAKSFVLDAKALYDELNGTVDEATEQQTHQELQARQEEVTKLVEELDKSEAKLVETIKNDALLQIDWLTKQDLRKMSDTLAEKVADLRTLMTTLLPNLDELNTAEDTARCKSRALSQVEEKLRHSWARLAPKLDDALYKELAVGDHSLDVVQAALANGKLSTAHKELQKAEEAYKKVQSAKK